MAAVDPNVTRWAPLVIQSLREAGIPEGDLARWTAAGLALIHYESRGNPEAGHPSTGAYGLTQQIKRWHPQHRGDPLEHLRHWARSMARYYGGQTKGHIPSTILVWGSGPGAVKTFVASGETVHSKVFRHIRNIEDMTAGRTWRGYSSWLTGWTRASSPTQTTRIGGRSLELATAAAPGDPLASPWDGYIRWAGKKRKVGNPGPAGLMTLSLDSPSLRALLPVFGIGALILLFLTWWGSGR